MKNLFRRGCSLNIVQEAPSEMPNLASEDEEEMLKKAIAMSLEEQ